MSAKQQLFEQAGFPADKVRAALQLTDFDTQKALEILMKGKKEVVQKNELQPFKICHSFLSG